MPGMDNKYKLIKKAMQVAATRPAGNVKPVVVGGGGRKLPSLNERATNNQFKRDSRLGSGFKRRQLR